MKFDIIVAHDTNHGIGINNQLPWNCPDDLQQFRYITTMGKKSAVIMGKNTWYSLPPSVRPLPRRENYVITRGDENLPPLTFDQALITAESDGCDRIFIIGGAQLYKMAIGHPSFGRMFATLVAGDYECDTFFNYDPHKLKKVATLSVVDNSMCQIMYERL